MNWSWLKKMFGHEEQVVLALSGGGARGLAHIGVLKELDHAGLKPALVTGTSIGAVVGALYCLHGNAEQLEKIAHDLIHSELFTKFDLDEMLDEEDEKHDSFEEFGARIRRIFTLSKMIRRESVVEPGLMEDVMKELFGEATFDDLRIPFAAVATDLITGEDITLRSGSLAVAVHASASIPGVFAPVHSNGYILVDGGVTRNVPVPEPGETLNAKVIAVDVMRGLYDEGPFKYGLDIIARTDWIAQIHLNRFFLNQADLVIVPNVRHVHWANFKHLDALILEGREALLDNLDEVKEMFA
ncbi:MAG: patatin-like phospholipase family protein [bacterium]